MAEFEYGYPFEPFDRALDGAKDAEDRDEIVVLKRTGVRADAYDIPEAGGSVEEVAGDDARRVVEDTEYVSGDDEVVLVAFEEALDRYLGIEWLREDDPEKVIEMAERNGCSVYSYHRARLVPTKATVEGRFND